MPQGVKHDREGNEFYLEVNHKKAYLAYEHKHEGVLNYKHTYVPPQLRGQGIAGKIVKQALEFAKQNNYKIIPTCSYVASYLNRHSELKIVVADE